MATELRYIGPLGGVDVPTAYGGHIVVMQGEIGKFPDDLATRLLEQAANWERVAAERTKTRTPTKDAGGSGEED